MTSTGWKIPMSVSQDSSSKINDGHACYDFADLNDILKDTFNYAYIPVSGGIDSLRASPVIYAYNYNFQIPATAKIDNVYVLPVFQQGNGASYGNVVKIKTIRLKTGNSLTDYGVGKNLASSDEEGGIKFVRNFKVPIQSWTTEDSFKEGGNYVLGGGDNPWGVELTPAVVNSTNFGFVFQVVGTEYKKWVMPRVAKLLMKIDYDGTTTTSNLKDSKETIKYHIKVGNEYKEITWDSFGTSTDTYSGLNVNNQDTPVSLKVVRKHVGKAGQSGITQLTSDDVLIGAEKMKSVTLPTLQYNGDEEEKEYASQEINIYPGFMGGTRILSVSSTSTKQGDAGFSRYIKFNVGGDTFQDMTDVNGDKLIPEGQFCKITKCSFTNNDASRIIDPKTNEKAGTGGAMYILTEHFQYANNTYGKKEEGTANTCGTCGDDECNLYYNGRKIE